MLAMSMPFDIVQVHARDISAFSAHLIRQARESGKDGAPATHFYAEGEFPPADHETEQIKGWQAGIGSPGWIRSWAARVGSTFVGHLTLRGPRLKASMHRADLGMGVELAHQGKGAGTRLLRCAIDWARTEPGLQWIDLGVFSDNERALRLYEKHGFKIWGQLPAAFIIDHREVTAVHMTLAV